MILNLTQHPATADQRIAGVVDLAGHELASLKQALTFDECPTDAEVRERAEFIAELACYNGLSGDDGDSPMPDRAMLGGALWLMAPLAAELEARGINPVFAFSKRDTSEETLPSGEVRKTAVFRHAGFVTAFAGGPLALSKTSARY